MTTTSSKFEFRIALVIERNHYIIFMALLTLAVYLPITAALLLVVYLMSGWFGLGMVAFFSIVKLLFHIAKPKE